MRWQLVLFNNYLNIKLGGKNSWAQTFVKAQHVKKLVVYN